MIREQDFTRMGFKNFGIGAPVWTAGNLTVIGNKLMTRKGTLIAKVESANELEAFRLMDLGRKSKREPGADFWVRQGFEAISDRRFIMHLRQPDSNEMMLRKEDRLPYLLALQEGEFGTRIELWEKDAIGVSIGRYIDSDKLDRVIRAIKRAHS